MERIYAAFKLIFLCYKRFSGKNIYFARKRHWRKLLEKRRVESSTHTHMLMTCLLVSAAASVTYTVTARHPGSHSCKTLSTTKKHSRCAAPIFLPKSFPDTMNSFRQETKCVASIFAEILPRHHAFLVVCTPKPLKFIAWSGQKVKLHLFLPEF